MMLVGFFSITGGSEILSKKLRNNHNKFFTSNLNLSYFRTSYVVYSTGTDVYSLLTG